MRKEEFLDQLRRALEGKTPPEELEDVLSYYEEYFADAGEDREEEAAQELGSPQAVAARLLEERVGSGAPEPPKKAGRKRSPWLIALLVLAGVVAVVAVVLALSWSRPARTPAPKPAQGTDLQPGGTPAPTVQTTHHPEPTHHGAAASVTQPPAVSPSSGTVDAAAGLVELDALDGFSSVEIELAVGTVLVQTGEGCALSLEWLDETGYLRYGVDRGKLKIWSVLGGGNQNNRQGGGVALTLPAGTDLSKVDVTVHVGKAELYDLSAGEVEVESNVGAVLLRGVSAGELDVNVDVGEVSLEDCSASLGLDVESGVGDIEVQGDFPCEVDFECGGELRFTTDRSLSEYRYELECKLGRVQVNGEDKGRSARGGSGGYEFSAECGQGDMDLRFGA